MINKTDLKRVLGEIPLTAEVYWQLRQAGKPVSKNFSMRRTRDRLPNWVTQASQVLAENQHPAGKRVLLFTTLRYWIEHAALMSAALAGLGHDVTFAYLPFANWHQPVNRFDLRRHNTYIKHILQPASQLFKTISMLDIRSANGSLPPSIQEEIEQISTRDVQYTLQIEEIDKESDLYHLRMERNTQAAHSALSWMQNDQPDVLLTPNGSILEMGAVYSSARYLDIPVVTYEFGEQRERIWLARDAEVMRQETDEMWSGRQEIPLNEPQWEQIRRLFSSRQDASLWENFSRRWQGIPSQGGDEVREKLGLDDHPVVLLAANVIGDSLTLGRQIFTENMISWLEKTVVQFAERPDAQLVVRIHPGERYTQGPSVADVVKGVLPEIPSNIHLIAADDPVNTYDLVEIADLGLVYTTTVGLEMAMSGVPVIVIGQTHYRGKDFTLDPGSWDEYIELMDHTLSGPIPNRLTKKQVERAWNYAYKFFFEYPCPYPWHLLHFWNELEDWPVSRVLSEEGQELYGETFRYLTGELRDWDNPTANPVYQDDAKNIPSPEAVIRS